MSPRAKDTLGLIFASLGSILAILFVASLIFLDPKAPDGFLWRKQTIGAVYSVVCILGILASFMPKPCSRATHLNRMTTAATQVAPLPSGDTPPISQLRIFGVRLVHSHHPPVKEFAAHEFRVGRRSFCAACMGLALGASLALIGAGTYFYWGWSFGTPLLVGTVGLIFVSLGLLQIPLFDSLSGSARLLVNALFIVGTLFALVAVDLNTGSFISDIYVIFSSLFWLAAKISLSRWRHEHIARGMA